MEYMEDPLEYHRDPKNFSSLKMYVLFVESANKKSRLCILNHNLTYFNHFMIGRLFHVDMTKNVNL